MPYKYNAFTGKFDYYKLRDPYYETILTSSGTYEGEVMTVTVDDASAAFGSPLYCEADFNYERADADAESSMPCRVLALESGSGSKKVLIKGQICNTSWNWSNGDVYVATISGTLTQTKPSGDGDIIHIIGRALSAYTIWFDPSPGYIVYAA